MLWIRIVLSAVPNKSGGGSEVRPNILGRSVLDGCEFLGGIFDREVGMKNKGDCMKQSFKFEKVEIPMSDFLASQKTHGRYDDMLDEINKMVADKAIRVGITGLKDNEVKSMKYSMKNAWKRLKHKGELVVFPKDNSMFVWKRFSK